MNPIQQVLPLPSLPLVKLIPSGAAARALRSIQMALAAVVIPLGVLVAMPLVGFLFFAIVLFSPVVLIYALVKAFIQVVKERRLSADRARRSAAVEAAFTLAAVRLAPSGEV
jgi:hypothetical protein